MDDNQMEEYVEDLAAEMLATTRREKTCTIQSR